MSESQQVPNIEEFNSLLARASMVLHDMELMGITITENTDKMWQQITLYLETFNTGE